jgi:transcriptional regulator with XRE-family HTH domain
VVIDGGVPLHERIKAARHAARISQAELAARCGCNQPAVVGWEQGTRTPSIKRLQRIAAALGVTVGDLVDSPVEPREPGAPSS